MVRIGGVDLPSNKKIEIALTAIYGIGIPTAKKLVTRTQINPEIRIKNLNDQEISSLRQIIETEYTIEGDLKRIYSLSIKRLIEINCLKGRRHSLGLPVRGQRTRTNARTRRQTQLRFLTKKKKTQLQQNNKQKKTKKNIKKK